MIGALFFMTSRGEVVTSRCFRDGCVVRTITDTFRDEVISTKAVDRSPINVVDKTCFVHMRFDNLLLVAAARTNANCFLICQYMTRLQQLLLDYFGRVDELALKDHFTAVQEIIDETLDFGYPQITETGLLKAFISGGGVREDAVRKTKEAERITIKATGKIPWRADNVVYKDNELFLDVVEEVNVLLSQSGDVLQREVVGRVVLRTFLSGTPECQLVLNDKTMLPAQQQPDAACSADAGAATTTAEQAVQLDDITFHPCVRLSAFDAERTVSFVPPDGEFVLIRYRSSGKLVPPMRILFSRAKELSKTRLEVDFHLQCDMDPRFNVTNVVVKIPCPAATANVKVRVLVGKAKYDPASEAIVWKIKRLEGGSTTAFSAEVNLIAVTSAASERIWGRPPISINFTSEMFTASGLKVERLTVTEPKLHYTPTKWIRYVSTAGQYQCRL